MNTTIDNIGLLELEQTSFMKCGESGTGIHDESCYVMFKNNQSGIAKIIRALKPYHSPTILKDKYQSSDEAGFFESKVGEPHLICECLEHLQYLRFQTVCDMKVEFVTPMGEQNN